jgi:Fe-S cluster assembly iron-binding protein IscA
MHIDLVEGGCETWAIRLRPGHLSGTPIARADGITLHAPPEQAALLGGLLLDYRGDLSGGGFLVRPTEHIRSCACGAAFTPVSR